MNDFKNQFAQLQSPAPFNKTNSLLVFLARRMDVVNLLSQKKKRRLSFLRDTQFLQDYPFQNLKRDHSKKSEGKLKIRSVKTKYTMNI